MEPFLKSLPTTLVFDHMACPDVKAGGRRQGVPELAESDRRQQDLDQQGQPVRSGSPWRDHPTTDVVPFRARAIVERFGDRVLWGTDWPHPNMKNEAAG